MRKGFLAINLWMASILNSGYCENLVWEHENGYAIEERGFWIGEKVVEQHLVDEHLAAALVTFFQEEDAESVVDFGCGTGQYVRILLDNDISCVGYDGNPDTPKITDNLCGVIDLSQPFDLDKKFEWVLSLEVGEHLPKKYEKTFIENLDRHNVKGIVLSWALKGQPGFGHYNTQDNDYIKAIMAHYGYINDKKAENDLRKGSSFSWFKHTVMVFRKPA